MPGVSQQVAAERPGGWVLDGSRLALAVVGFAALLMGCAAAPQRIEPAAPLFYPLPPSTPRIQYLTTLSSAADLGVTRGAFARFILGESSTDDGLRRPYGVAFAADRLLVVDSGAAGVASFHLGERRFDVARGLLRKPIHLWIDPEGRTLVTDTVLREVVEIDAAGRKVAAWTLPAPFRPGGVAAAGERLYVTDLEGRRVVALDRATGERLFEFGGPGRGDLIAPTALTLGPQGEVFVSDAINARVQQFDPDGALVRTYGSLGSAPGQFSRPKGVAVDREGRLYVVDAAFENVQMFDPEGRLLMYFGGPGTEVHSLSLPAGIAIDYANVHYFQRYASPGFALEYVIAVTNQASASKVVVFGFGAFPEAGKPSWDGR